MWLGLCKQGRLSRVLQHLSMKAGAVIAVGNMPVEELPDSHPRCLLCSIVGMLPHETVSGGACPVTAM